LVVEGGKAVSPLRSPFAALDVSKNVEPEVIFRFVEHTERRLRKRGVREIVVKHAPDAYHGSVAPVLHTCFFSQGYQVVKAEPGAVIEVHSETLLQKLDPWEKRRRNQALAQGVSVSVVENDQLRMVYDFLKKCREERNHRLSMNWKEMEELNRTCGDNLLLFAVRKQETLAAASLSLRVRPDILYNFYSGHLRRFDRLSPVVTLFDSMNSYCYRQGIRLLDLGTSSLEEGPNFPLFGFKLRMGATPTLKLTVAKKL
jgi:lipid II:glycine glycyltransferase (peptidoglycan interpeptide bridge formation enzyme)